MSNDKQPKTAITPTRAEDYAEWYQQVVKAADLAETRPVRGCMVIKPWGYAIWENIQRELDGHVQGHRPQERVLSRCSSPRASSRKRPSTSRASPRSAPSSRTTASKAGPTASSSPIPAKLEEPLVVRPTSETIIGEAFALWVQSYRDLPLLINQWANVVRWELRTRLFLRTTEFLWQEGHTAHATEDEAARETRCRCSRCTRRSPSSSWRCP
jgi:prolyl-tRNA synthetase